MEYEVLTNSDDEAIACESCGMEAPVARFSGPMPRDPARFYCEFCSTTMTSRFTVHPPRTDQDFIQQEIWKAAACVFNMLMKGKGNE